MTALTEFRAALQAERDKAQRVVEAIDLVLALYPVVVVAPVTTAAPKPRKAAPPPKAPVLPMRSPRQAPADAASSKTSRYGDAIVRFLSSFAQAPHHAADSAVLRREVAKACKVDPAKDGSFVGDISNALQGLKRAGVVDRSGTMWALVNKPAAAGA